MQQSGSARQSPSITSALSWKIILAALLVTCVVGSVLYSALDAYVLAQAQEEIQGVLLTHRGIHHYIQRDTHPALYKLIEEGEVPEDFYSPELLSSSFMLRKMNTYFNEERAEAGLPPLHYRLAALNPRNPVNLADEGERNIIDLFNNDRKLTFYRQVVEINGQKFLYLALPFLPNNQACLKCHGVREEAPRQLQARYPGPGGFGERLGQIRAIESVRAPLESDLKVIHLVFIALLSGMVALISLLVFNRRLSAKVRARTEDLEKELAERQRAEASLQESREYLSTLVESSRDGIVTVDNDHRITTCNRAFCELYGYRPEDVLGRSSRLLHHSDENFAEFGRIVYPEVAATGFWKGEWEFRDKDGSPVPVELVISGHKGRDKSAYGFVALHRDISERRRAEAEKTRLEAQLLQAQKMEAVGTLAGGIAHDFNNMLGSITGYTEMVSSEMPEGSQARRDLEQVLAASERASELVKRILTFSRKVEVELTPLNLNREVERAVALLRRTIPKMISIQTHLDPGLETILGNAVQLEQVILNLASNAVDAMPEGGRLEIETANVTLDEAYCRQDLDARPGRYVLLQVTDTGQGLDEETRRHVFDPFFTTKEVGKGTGLGLSMLYGIVKSHGGHVFCYSEPGQGASFKLYFPVQGWAPGEKAGGPDEPYAPAGRGETLLLADDDQALRTVGARILEKAGYRVLQAESGEQALMLHAKGAPGVDLVILDLGMPGMGGFRCLAELLAASPGTKVLIASGYAAEGQVDDALAAGARGFVAKPFRRAELLAAVRFVLDAGQD